MDNARPCSPAAPPAAARPGLVRLTVILCASALLTACTRSAQQDPLSAVSQEPVVIVARSVSAHTPETLASLVRAPQGAPVASLSGTVPVALPEATPSAEAGAAAGGRPGETGPEPRDAEPKDAETVSAKPAPDALTHWTWRWDEPQADPALSPAEGSLQRLGPANQGAEGEVARGQWILELPDVYTASELGTLTRLAAVDRPEVQETNEVWRLEDGPLAGAVVLERRAPGVHLIRVSSTQGARAQYAQSRDLGLHPEGALMTDPKGSCASLQFACTAQGAGPGGRVRLTEPQGDDGFGTPDPGEAGSAAETPRDP